MYINWHPSPPAPARLNKRTRATFPRGVSMAAAWLLATTAATFRSTLYSLYRNGPRSAGGWAGARDATVCAQLLGTKSEHVWVDSPIACDEEIRADFEAKFVLAYTVAYFAVAGVLFLYALALLKQATWAAASAGCGLLCRACSRPAAALPHRSALVRHERHRAPRRRRDARRARRPRRDPGGWARHPMLVDETFIAAPRLPSLSSLSSSPSATTPGSASSDWGRTPSPDSATPARSARRTPHVRRRQWPGTPARAGLTSDASM